MYNLNLRTLDDLEIYYGVEREEIEGQSEIIEVEEKPRKAGWMRGQHEDEGLGDSWVKVAIGLREDLMKKYVTTLYARHEDADTAPVCKDSPGGGRGDGAGTDGGAGRVRARMRLDDRWRVRGVHLHLSLMPDSFATQISSRKVGE